MPTDIEGTRTALGLPPFPRIAPISSEDRELSADKETGAIILRIVSVGEPGVWGKAGDVPVKTTFNTRELGLEFPDLKFTKVEDLWWGENFKGVSFTNLSGFHFRFQDDKSQIAHLQRRTAGKEPESAGPGDFDKVPLPRLNEHGGLWYRDSYGDAVRGHNDIISFPWHKWQGGKGKNVDVWLALGFNPDLAQYMYDRQGWA
ncbi:hypothetical protein CORC01_14400 [Colletotrichum orchidophilum]|uniref:Aldos-2-ulose dehydratase/isomerase (AUDH) Cupin domain-containing protein n=1 Tax=Colletotrichum orchidophilum TaxID=1209926 RepID=A0A1G4AM91_9PEZI|nr:uncharacterized protein CORC01_14400 [Colletotrichum orchidophilum]OHE90300.1 hypothetical protein CORC01_14400 [Colletotrichum orchidophilum]